jgi:hypothetical protein
MYNTMTQGQSIAHPIPHGAVKITECSNTPAKKLPTLAILVAAAPATNDHPAQPAESMILSHMQVSALYQALHDYYHATP